MFLFSNFESDAPTVLANGRAYNAPLAKLLFANALNMTMLPCRAYVIGYTPASNLGYLAPPRTIFHGCQIVHWDPLDAKQRCPQKKFGLGYV